MDACDSPAGRQSDRPAKYAKSAHFHKTKNLSINGLPCDVSDPDKAMSISLTLRLLACLIDLWIGFLCGGNGQGATLRLASRIRVARQRTGLTQAQLAHAVRVARTSVTNWECELARPSASHLKTLARFTEVSFEWLATGRGPMTPENDPDRILAVDADIVDDPQERRLLRAFRAASRRRRARILALIEAENAERPVSLRRA